MKKWEDLPKSMQNSSVKKYYNILQHRKASLFLKRFLDIVFGLIGLVILSPVFVILAIVIKKDSRGPVFYKQERITRYGRSFKILKFRTMVQDADKIGALVTTKHDNRITRIGKIIRKIRLDEIPQLINIIKGEMSFVGTRPEATKYVKRYKNEYLATLLLPAGVTSEASIRFKDEDVLLDRISDIDKTYVEDILPQKMKYNLKSIETFSILKDIQTIGRTIFAILGKEYK